jgi:hypothetical protein
MFAHTLRAVGVALALALTVPLPAQPKPQPSPPPVGATREQVLERLGEPTSLLKAGAREILFFSHVKVTLRNDVVVDTEELADEAPPPAPRPAEPPAAAAKSADATAPPAAPGGSPAPAVTPAAAPDATAPAKPVESVTPAVSPPRPAREADSGLVIRVIHRPATGATSAPVSRAPLAQTAAAAASAKTDTAKSLQTAAVAPVASAPVATVAKLPLAPAETATSPKSSTEPVSDRSTASATANMSAEEAKVDSAPSVGPGVTPPVETVVAEQDKVAVAPTPKPPTASKLLFRRHRTDATEPALTLFSAQTYVLAVIAVGCIGYLFWRRSQRQMELAATTVSNTPFSAPVADTGALFTADMLGKLDAGKFERLVASYYTKTGVVAEPAHGGPDAAIHIKIFWKGEPKPFAGVQCHARPPTLIPVNPLQALFAALSAAEIRRGYVVTTGKFNVEARDFAEEKHFTLLPGDLLLEKLNALPPGARADLLKETAAEPDAPASNVAT